MTGVIFDIKEFALHDGPGVRTTVFFKGCPLRCVWCHNPEGLHRHLQLMTKESRCRHCGKCQVPCHHEACRPFDRCLYACPDALISLCGQTVTEEALTERLLRDRPLLTDSEGGITFSGGEPLMQGEFLLGMLRRLRAEGMHTAVETSGFAEKSLFCAVAMAADYIIMDVKLADPAAHRMYTGVDNAGIRANAAWLQKSGIPHEFRTPLIPGITDTETNLEAIRALVGDSRHELLPYNALAGAKYPMLGMEFPYDRRNFSQTEKEW